MLKAILASDHRFWRFFALFAGAAAFLKGIRQAPLSAASQAQFTYDLGLIRRGLFGTIAQQLHIPIHHYAVFAAISYVLMALLVLAFAYAIWRSELLSTLLGSMLCAVFLSSYAVTFAAHLVGRFDIVQMALTLIIVSIGDSLRRNLLLLVLAPLSILLHENFFIAFLPICVLPTLLEFLCGPKRPSIWAAAACVGAVAASAVTVVIVAAFQYSNQPALLAMRDRIAAHVDFSMDPAVIGILSRGIVYNAALETGWVWRNGARWVDLPFSLLIYLPSAALLMFCCWRILKTLDPRRARLAICAIVLCVAAPLTLNLIASDLDRWNVFLLFDSFAALLFVAGPAFAAGAAMPRATPNWAHAAIFLVATNLASGGGLYDQKVITPYPFRGHVGTIYNTLQGRPPARPTR
jgi:hypothetical protein